MRKSDACRGPRVRDDNQTHYSSTVGARDDNSQNKSSIPQEKSSGLGGFFSHRRLCGCRRDLSYKLCACHSEPGRFVPNINLSFRARGPRRAPLLRALGWEPGRFVDGGEESAVAGHEGRVGVAAWQPAARTALVIPSRGPWVRDDNQTQYNPLGVLVMTILYFGEMRKSGPFPRWMITGL
jgi:hypothetical protein